MFSLSAELIKNVVINYTIYFRYYIDITMWLIRSNKAAGGFFGFQRVMSEPTGKEGKLQHNI
jgi:hypothetical protein